MNPNFNVATVIFLITSFPGFLVALNALNRETVLKEDETTTKFFIAVVIGWPLILVSYLYVLFTG